VRSGGRGSKALGAYALERLLNAVPLVLGVVVVNFLLISLAPGDPVTALIGEFPAPPEYVERVRAQYGLDRPVPERLLRYLGSVVRGDLGFSFANRQPVFALVTERLGSHPAAHAVDGGAGHDRRDRPRGGRRAAAELRGRPRRHRLRARRLLDPRVLVGQVLILVFAVELGWLPAGGFRSIRADYVGWAAASTRPAT
jgi:peptide/nickel transport system permease protein